MKIRKVDVQGFRSFGDAQRLDLEALRPGLYHLAGRNGAGKSSLLEAIHWAFYGKTSRGLKAGDVKNWQGKERCSVIVSLQGDDLCREQGRPNLLEVRSSDDILARPVDQTFLDEEVLRCPQSAFDFAIYFPQFAPSFVDLDPPKQTEIFTDVLRLHAWEAAADSSSTSAGRLEKELIDLREQQAGLRGQAQELLAVDYGAQERAWDAEHKARQATADRGRKVAEAAVLAAERAATAARTTAAAGLPARERLAVAATGARQAEANLREQRAAVRALQAQDIKNCPTCGAPMSVDHIQKELTAASKKEVGLGDIFDAAMRSYEKAEREALKFDGAERLLFEAEQAVAAANMNAAVAAGNANTLRAERNPYTRARAQADVRGEQLAQELEAVSAKISETIALLEACVFWTKGFKEIRLLEIEHSLAQLTLETNEVLFQIGLPDWSIEFDIERETKKGTVKKNFTTLIHAPGAKAGVPWEAWSGGESQRLRLAIAMGFANLICARLGLQPNVEFWDEPSTWLDDVSGLLEALSERARRYGRIILLADHRVLDFGGFAGTITVVKGEGGSRIEIH